MVRFPNATVAVASLTDTRNAEGSKIKTYDFKNPLDSFRADVQPNTLTQYQVDLYGIDAKTANTKKCFFNFSAHMQSGNRAKVTYDSGKVEYYNICPVAEWRIHSEALLIPVENENN